MELLASLASEKNTVRANIHQFSDPNAINKINMQTRIIIGDDAATNHKLSSTAASNMKSLTTGQPLNLPMKYKENVIVRTRAPFIQGTNTDINFFENNKALSSRLVVIEWTPTNYRDKKREITFNLDNLITKQDFIDDFFMMCLEKVKYFDEFTIPQSVKDASAEMLENNDTIFQFMEDILHLINYHSVVPLKLLYGKYIEWTKLNNPKGGIMKYPSFRKALFDRQHEFNFKMSEKRSTVKTYEFIMSLLCGLDVDSQLIQDRQKWISFEDAITNEELSKFKNQAHPVKDLDDRQEQIVRMLINDKQENWLRAIYNM